MTALKVSGCVFWADAISSGGMCQISDKQVYLDTQKFHQQILSPGRGPAIFVQNAELCWLRRFNHLFSYRQRALGITMQWAYLAAPSASVR